jgi:hypothetical protein
MLQQGQPFNFNGTFVVSQPGIAGYRVSKTLSGNCTRMAIPLSNLPCGSQFYLEKI